MTTATYLQATASVIDSGKGNFIVKGVIVTAGADAASCTLLTSDGDTKVVVKAPLGLTKSVSLHEASFPLGIAAVITGTTPSVTIIWGTG